MKKYLPLLLLFCGSYTFAQTYNDEALLYSRAGLGGTARTIGSGGAYGSVGADLGSMSINPAGLGLYRSTDMCFTPALIVSENEAEFNGSFKTQRQTKPAFSQAGAVFTKLFKRASSSNDFSFNPNRLNAISFAINYQRQAGFARVESFEGTNSANSGIDAYTSYLNDTKQTLNTDNYPLEMVLANEAKLMLYDTVTGNYYSNVHARLAQSGTVITKGGIDKVDIAFGGNLNDKFYFGLGLGVPILTYMSDASFNEYDSADSLSGFVGYNYSTNLRATGIGVNAMFGIIYRPVSWMRFGLAYHIPTFYSITETFSGSMVSEFDSGYYQPPWRGTDPFKYKLKTPMKGTVSASFYLKEHGFFSVDYEFQNYGSSRFNFGSVYKSYSDQVNAEEKKNYTFGHVVRAGFEGSYKSLRVRAGYAFSSTPYKKDVLTKGYASARNTATVGIGYRGKRFYADFAYAFGYTRDADYPYADFEVKNTLTSHSMFLTLGYKISKDEAPVRKRVAKSPPPPDF